MAIPVLVMGRSGSGKTYSIKNFAPDQVGVISVEKGRLPFRSKIKVVRIPEDLGADVKNYAQLNAARYAWVEMVIKNRSSCAPHQSAVLPSLEWPTTAVCAASRSSRVRR